MIASNEIERAVMYSGPNDGQVTDVQRKNGELPKTIPSETGGDYILTDVVLRNDEGEINVYLHHSANLEAFKKTL